MSRPRSDLAVFLSVALLGCGRAAGPQTPQPLDGPSRPSAARVDLGSLYWATERDGVTTIDMIDVGPPSGSTNPVMALAEAHGHPDGVERALPREAALPAGFAVGDRWILATTMGPVSRSAIAFGATVGASESHFVVVLDGAHTGLAARGEAWGGDVPTLRAAAPIAITRPSDAPFLAAVAARLAEAADREDAREVLRRSSLRPEHVHVVAGRFPRQMTRLVSVRVPAPDGSGPEHVAALVLADAGGRCSILIPAHMTTETYTARYLIDLEGDGRDEVIYESRGHESRFMRLLAWDGDGSPDSRTLTGDGA